MSGQRVLIDTGPLVAVLDGDDPAHEKCVDAFRSLPAPSYTCWPVLTEACYLLRRYPNAVGSLLEKISGGDLVALHVTPDDIGAIREVLKTYDDKQVDLADACLVHLANRESIDRVLTLDRRHFSVFRNVRGDAFQILPN